MSMSYSSRTTPRSSASQGRIVTENSALSAILRERSKGNIGPAPRTASVYSPALDVVPSNVDVVNVSNAETNNNDKQNLQYIVVSKSTASLNTATNPEQASVNDNTDSPLETESDSRPEVQNSEPEHIEEAAPTSSRQLVDPQPQAEDSSPRQSYSYYSLKSQKKPDQNRDHSKYSLTGEKSESAPSHVGDNVTQELVDVNVTGDTNENAHVNSRQNSHYQQSGKDSVPISSAQDSSDRNIAPVNGDKQFAREQSERQNSLHERQHSQLVKQRTRDHSFAQQNTRLSLNSQYDRVSRGRTPLRVNTQDQIVPPLDLSGVNRSIPEPVRLSSPKASSHDSYDQNLHASDQKNSLVYFSSREYNPNSTTARTYGVTSPVLSNQLPHVNSSANFRAPDEDQDTYRERQQEPSRIEQHRSDLADDLKVPYPFDSQAGQGDQTARDPRPPSPPVQTTPPPAKEPATSLRSSSNIYTVANPEVQRAQGFEPPQSDPYQSQRQYSNTEARHSGHSEVRFNSESRRPPSLSNRTYGGSPVKDRAPTPYAKSPVETELPKTPPDWEVPKEEKSREQSNASKRSLPPQHPPLDTLHSKPSTRQNKRGQEDNQSIKRVYVESPSFTKEEEEEYRFVNSRLDDHDDHKQNTLRQMDNTRRGYGGDDNPRNSYAKSEPRREERKNDDYGHQRRSYEQDRYEDRNQENGDYFYKDRYEDRRHELSGRYDERAENKENRGGNERFNERMREYDRYPRSDRYERLQDERADYDMEPRREDETGLQRGYGKQNTEIDERDLRREAEYQMDLKRRIDKQNKTIKQSEKYDKENDFRRDSLEYQQDNRNMGFVQDSLEYNNYDSQQQDWENAGQTPDDYPGEYMKQDSKPDFYDPDDAEKMDIVNPKAPKYDYVEHNKEDYGKNPKKSYREIVYRQKEEAEKLDHIFISPKVPSKHGKKHKPKKAQSAQPEHMGYHPQNQYPAGFKPSSAEELWAQRARVLSEKKGSAGNGKPAKTSASKGVPRWNTNPQVKKADRFVPPAPLPNQGQMYKPIGSATQTSVQGGQGYSQGGYGTPTRLQPLENRPPAAPVSHEIMPTAVNPSSPFRRHAELKPITQEITTEDGQRIHVDINLRLISPPPGQSGQISPGQQQLALVPVQETQGPYVDQRGVGVPYQMQDSYGNPNQYSQDYQEDYNSMVPYNNGYQNPLQTEADLMAAEGQGYEPYTGKYQPGTVTFKDDVVSNADAKSLEDGYAALYQKMRNKDPSEHPWYKIYNMNDYKKMQREVRLNRGTLGPDLDTETYKDKMEKRHKQFEYARMVMEKNRMELGHKKPPKFPRDAEKSGEQSNAKRRTALEYAKNVPKPHVKPRPNQYNSYEVASQLTPGGHATKMRSPGGSKQSPTPTQTIDVIDIRTLEQRHLQERQKTDKIRRNMDSVLSQKAH